jgi:hypothetical protein
MKVDVGKCSLSSFVWHMLAVTLTLNVTPVPSACLSSVSARASWTSEALQDAGTHRAQWTAEKRGTRCPGWNSSNIPQFQQLIYCTEWNIKQQYKIPLYDFGSHHQSQWIHSHHPVRCASSYVTAVTAGHDSAAGGQGQRGEGPQLWDSSGPWWLHPARVTSHSDTGQCPHTGSHFHLAVQQVTWQMSHALLTSGTITT